LKKDFIINQLACLFYFNSGGLPPSIKEKNEAFLTCRKRAVEAFWFFEQWGLLNQFNEPLQEAVAEDA
jgi:hypothetical protein